MLAQRWPPCATSVLDLTAEFSAQAGCRASAYHALPVLDLTSPTPEQLAEVAELIEQESGRGTILVHCKRDTPAAPERSVPGC
jgi:protein-tyrosine phosphatase